MSDPIGCLTEGCGKVSWRRGCCPTCYGRHQKAVLKGETTWQKLQEEGKVHASKNFKSFPIFGQYKRKE